MSWQQAQTPGTGMQRPDGVVANAPSLTKMTTGASMCTMSHWTKMLNDDLMPATQHAAAMGLTPAQMMQITGGRLQSRDRRRELGMQNWKRDERWKAHPILDFLYLGAFNMATNREFLMENKISKMISIRDSRFADSMMFMYDKVAASLGIEMESFDVPSAEALVPLMPRVVDNINRHMLSRPVDASGASTGRVFVFCETGNIRSAAVVLVYISCMYNINFNDAWGFMVCNRHSVSLDDDIRRILVSYEQLFQARLDVLAVGGQATDTARSPGGEAVDPSMETGINVKGPFLTVPRAGTPNGKPVKRSIEETIDLDDDRVEFTQADASGVPSRDPSAEPAALNLDYARYENRSKFQPFSDTGGDQYMQ